MRAYRRRSLRLLFASIINYVEILILLFAMQVSNIGPHYARTLREWRRRFLERFDDVIVPALVKEYPAVMGGQRGRSEIEVFKRKWICECDFIPLISCFQTHLCFQTTSKYSVNGGITQCAKGTIYQLLL